MGSEIKRFGKHENAFGFFRLLLASLVIVAHTPEMLDGNRNREILYGLFGTMTFGDLAVDGFFLISGYLIVGSYVKNPDIFDYLRKRVVRIFPAFIVASLTCLFVVAPLAGVWLTINEFSKAVFRMAVLAPPYLEGVFSGTNHAVLNGAAWTIAYEFRCYLLVMALGAFGFFAKPQRVILAILGIFACDVAGLDNVLEPYASALPLSQFWLGDLTENFRLIPLFLVGAVFYLYQEQIVFDRALVVLAAFAGTIALYLAPLAHFGVGLFGGYAMFALAKWGGRTIFARINNKNDISYGLYLYAWPIEKLLFWFLPGLGLVATGVLTWAGAMVAGTASWVLLERPVMKRWGRSIRKDIPTAELV